MTQKTGIAEHVEARTMRGVIKRIVLAREYGFLVDDEGQTRFMQLKPMSRYYGLREGDTVTFIADVRPCPANPEEVHNFDSKGICHYCHNNGLRALDPRKCR